MATSTILLPIPPHAYDATNPARLGVQNGLYHLLFDDTQDEICFWQLALPADFASGLTFHFIYSMAGANTSDEIQFEYFIWKVSDGAAMETPGNGTVNTSAATTVPDTAGIMDTLATALSNIDGAVAGDWIRVQLNRNAGGGVGVDDAVGDVEIRAAWLTYTTS